MKLLNNKSNLYKLQWLGLIGLTSFAIAIDNAPFQQFENQYNLGYGFSQGTLIDGVQNTSWFNTQYTNLELERLFNVGVWLNANFDFVTQYTQPNLGRLNGGDGSGVPLGQYPFMWDVTFKTGYAFSVVDNYLQLIPYAMLGRRTNWATSTANANGWANLTTDYFYTGGLGGRIYYRINDAVILYGDELYSYNWDNSGAIKSIQTSPSLYGKSYAATNYMFVSTIGAKFNIVKNLQLGANLFWNNFQPQSNISGLMYTPTNTFGEEVSIGLTY